MAESDLAARYNYDAFVPENFEQWLNFEDSQPVGRRAPDFLLWTLEGAEKRLSALWTENTYTVVEFGSFT